MERIESTQSWRRTQKRAFLAVPVLLIVGVLCLHLVPSMGLQKELLAIRNAGLPISSAELDAWYRQVPTSENAAVLVEEAIRVHVTAPPELDLSTVRLPKPGEAPSSELKDEIAAYIEENDAALKKLHAAAERSESRYPIDLTRGANTLLPHLSRIKGLAQLLRFEAMHHSASGHRELAVRSLNSGFGLARTLHKEPVLISELVRIASIAIILDALERVLSDHQLTDDELTSLSRQLVETESDSAEASYRAMVGERAGGIEFFSMSAGRLDQLGFSGSPTPVPTSALRTIAFGAYRLLGFRDRDLRMYLTVMQGFTAAATNGFPEALRKSEQVGKEMDSRFKSGFGRFAIISRMVLPALGKAMSKEAGLLTRLRCARLALATEQYRLAHGGSLPNLLAELVPQYLRELPRDPVEAQPFQYETNKTVGYSISSPGAGTKLQNQKSATFGVFR